MATSNCVDSAASHDDLACRRRQTKRGHAAILLLILGSSALAACTAAVAGRATSPTPPAVGATAASSYVSTKAGSVAEYTLSTSSAGGVAPTAATAAATPTAAAATAATDTASTTSPVPKETQVQNPTPSAESLAVVAVSPISNATLTPVPSLVAAAASNPTPTAALSTSPKAAPTAAPSVATWTLDLYNAGAERYQDPDYTACTAASTESMLNTIGDDGSPSGFVWQPTTSYSTQESILGYERANMTMLSSSAGTDPHGWRNALNYYGWGSIDAGVYRDISYGSFDAAAKATVIAIATTRKPVGILAHAGAHAQFVTGYKVTGVDPSTGSSDFTVVGIDLTDPLRSNGHRDAWITYSQWRSGGTWVKFSSYRETDSPYTDPIDGHVGKGEWYGKWVIIAPVK